MVTYSKYRGEKRRRNILCCCYFTMQLVSRFVVDTFLCKQRTVARVCVCILFSISPSEMPTPINLYYIYIYTEIAKVYGDMYLRDQFKECLCIDNTHHKFTCQNTTATILSASKVLCEMFNQC